MIRGATHTLLALVVFLTRTFFYASSSHLNRLIMTGREVRQLLVTSLDVFGQFCLPRSVIILSGEARPFTCATLLTAAVGLAGRLQL